MEDSKNLELFNSRKKILLDNLLGNLKKYLWEDDNVTEIQINSDSKIWIDTFQGEKDTGEIFEAEKSKQLINFIASEIGTSIGYGKRIVSGNIPFTLERFEGLLPPVVKPNPVITIRKKPTKIFTLDNYVEVGSLTITQKETIKKAIREYKNILVIGSTGSGKTTFCNAIIKEIEDMGDRLIFIEETPELMSTNPNSVFLESVEGITMTQLFTSTMRLSPKRIIIGEVRGAEAIDLLTAWNSGHSGGVCTIHSSSVIGGLTQLERYIRRSSADSQSETIGITVNIGIVIEKFQGKRRIKEIKEIKGYKNGEYILEDIN
ncbi:ATPase, T2SS/T4P/T4SS family [Fusobacterium sp. FSA-380-WT-2B]|uniref:ATPase, T2SS/T4P/T4SS family n=1 Tax=Fusobacterium sp. FSA-380-WT-2B TaxID=2605786 RepID=UPI0012B27966|nr:ATPase, T2SS/T4P/T4SS family [Fusobacterium sp. FSA-380-WT-2B]MSS62126.1 type IV secretion system DNA-binding domain-containing protein [Fusobacterium sp. FSA-380-WT-2B]